VGRRVAFHSDATGEEKVSEAAMIRGPQIPFTQNVEGTT
jgi:hypothetical protein